MGKGQNITQMCKKLICNCTKLFGQ